LLGTTTSYNHFASTCKYQLVADLRAVVAGSLKNVLLANLRDAPCFGIQFDETTDLGNDFPLHWQAQLIAYVRFPDKERMEIVDLQADHLFSIPAGIAITATSIFEKLTNNFSERGAMWLKCKTVPMGSARAMVGIRNDVVALS